MDTLHIGMKAEYAEELFDKAARAARDAMNRAGEDEIPAELDFEITATDNDNGSQVIIHINNDDMERDDVARHDVIVEAD